MASAVFFFAYLIRYTKYVNDIENDDKYRMWPKSLRNLLQMFHLGMLSNIRRNMFHMVIIADPSKLSHKFLYKMAESFYVHNAPVRIGLVFAVNPDMAVSGFDDAGVAMLNAFNFISVDESPYDGLSFMTDVYLHVKDEPIEAQHVIQQFKKKYSDEDLELIFGVGSDYDTGRKLAWGFVNKTGFGEIPKVIINGVPLEQKKVTESDFEEAALMEIIQQQQKIAKAVYHGKLEDNDEVLDWLMSKSHVLPRLNKKIITNNNAVFLDFSGQPVKENLSLESFQALSAADMTATILKDIKYMTMKGNDVYRPNTIKIVTDLESKDGRELLRTAIEHMRSTNAVRLGVIHHSSDNKDLKVTKAFEAALHTFNHKSFKKFVNILLKKAGEFSSGAISLDDLLDKDMDAEKFNSYYALLSSESFEKQSYHAKKVLNLQVGQKMLITDGKVIGPFNDGSEIKYEDFDLFEKYSNQVYTEIISNHLKALDVSPSEQSEMALKVSSILMSQSNIQTRTDLKYKSDDYSVIKITEQDLNRPAIDIHVVVDPVSQGAQKLAPLVAVLKDVVNANIKIFLNSQEKVSDMPLKNICETRAKICMYKVKECIAAENIQWAEDFAKRKLKFAGHIIRGQDEHKLARLVMEGLVEGKKDRGRQRRVWGDDLKECFYQYVLEPEPLFKPQDGSILGPRARFIHMPTAPLFTLAMVTSDNWLVEAVKTPYDLDNIHLQDVENFIHAEFELKHLLLEVLSNYDMFAGHCFEQATGNPPRGLQFNLGNHLNPYMFDTIVMANLGYFQLKANVGAWTLQLRQGRSTEIYDVASHENTDSPGSSDDMRIIIDSFKSKVIKIRLNNVWELLYADDIALLAEDENQLQQRINAWQLEIERKGLRVNAKETEVMVNVRKESESIHLCDRSGEKLNQVENFRRMLKIKYTDHMTNKKVKECIAAENIQWAEDFAKRKLKFAGHIIRGQDEHKLARLVMEGLVEGKKDRGRQRRVWGDDLKEWSKSTSIGQMKRQAENRDVWKKMVHDLRFEDVTKKPGQEHKEILDDEDEVAQKGIWNSITSSFLSEKTEDNDEGVINIFSLASGHLYERFLRIMMLSVLKNTKSPVKFWFLKNFLSPTIKDFLPHMAVEYGFEYELVEYKWPRWLHQQKEKQRIIWGYKILFLDVLFPLHVKKIIFVDADQVVRADMKELVNFDLEDAPYGYTPFCESRPEMDGYSALYVVDLKKFRQVAAGDRLRGQYHGLSQDPNSLSNLDQDLPNNMIHQVKIKSLPQSWLWCETWCDNASKSEAKTIDLCNNPKTKEPKLTSAMRIISEWKDYDQEIKDLQQRVASSKQSNESNDKSIPKIICVEYAADREDWRSRRETFAQQWAGTG
ncbi:UDP-glucose:glycoprotein glucosyltransferase 1 [Nymphon striatum]|nr:UDP-glucose:glycoprotein glucosyltransferase 1 [Nymphon striatum]